MEWTEVAEDLLDRTGIATHPGSDDINGWCATLRATGCCRTRSGPRSSRT